MGMDPMKTEKIIDIKCHISLMLVVDRLHSNVIQIKSIFRPLLSLDLIHLEIGNVYSEFSNCGLSWLDSLFVIC